MAENLGIATVKVGLYHGGVPFINKDPKIINFDINAHNWSAIVNSPYFPPLLLEQVHDTNENFAAIHPAKRKAQKNNYLAATAPAGQVNVVTWSLLAAPPTGLPADLVEKEEYSQYAILQPPYAYGSIPPNYLGPIWEDNAIELEPPPDDDAKIAAFEDQLNSGDDGGDDTNNQSPSAPTEIPKAQVIFQKQVRDGLWWAIESSDFLPEDNIPFWVNFRYLTSPSSAKHDTCFIIRIGDGDVDNQFDIYLSFNNRPRIIDYLNSDNPPQIQAEWDNDISRILSSEKNIEVGIMTIAGRLVVSVNKSNCVYTRMNRESGDDGGKFLEAKIKRGKIKIFGTNCQTLVSICPMTFAKKSMFAFGVPSIVEANQSSPTDVTYKGVDKHGDPNGSVAELTNPPSNPGKRWGVDCADFSGDGGSGSPSGVAYHKLGKIKFQKADQSEFSALPSTTFHTLKMFTGSITGWEKYSGAPYFFQLKGIYKKDGDIGGGPTDISNNVVSIEETAQAPDYYCINKSATITCYNEHNEIGDMVLTGQTGITISWGWNGDVVKTFTGLVNSVSKSEVAGKETITLSCVDYMCVLKVPMINSPFYDGMVSFYAIRDMATRAGISNVVKDWDNEDEYFCNAGFGFTKPKLQFSPSQTIFDCIKIIVSKDQAFVYFDGEGKFHVSQNEGGLFAEGATASINFSSDPFSSGGSTNVILEERTVDISYESTLNQITIMTVDRDTRNAIIIGKTATSGEDNLLYRKSAFKNEAAYGEPEVAKAVAADMALRMFNPILKTRFKTAGAGSVVLPLAFMQVDGYMFKILSIKRSFNAETNDMNCSYEGEWLFGA